MLTWIAIALGVLNSLAVVWCVLATLDMRSREKYIEYALGIAFYNDTVQATSGRPLSPEEEWGIVEMQTVLAEQAKDIGLQFVPFDRPAGND